MTLYCCESFFHSEQMNHLACIKCLDNYSAFMYSEEEEEEKKTSVLFLQITKKHQIIAIYFGFRYFYKKIIDFLLLWIITKATKDKIVFNCINFNKIIIIYAHTYVIESWLIKNIKKKSSKLFM